MFAKTVAIMMGEKLSINNHILQQETDHRCEEVICFFTIKGLEGL
jgi:hypothetical protein